MSETAIYVPYKCKLKLTRMELGTLTSMMPRVYLDDFSLDNRMVFEWAMKKRFEWTRRIMDGKKHYSVILKSDDAFILQMIFRDWVVPEDDYERAIMYSINGKIMEV